MDHLRWILLLAGFIFIVAVYLVSRKNRQDFYDNDEPLDDDLPEISPRSLDDLDEGVGEVRIVARQNDYDDEPDDIVDEDPEPVSGSAPAEKIAHTEAVLEEAEDNDEHELSEKVIVLNIIAREGSTLSGKSINSVAHANNMTFGEMDIYHRYDANRKPVFSLVNMLKPGVFKPATMHDMNTPGVSLFLQLPGPEHPSEAFDDMLDTAYRMSELLEARLCDSKRRPMTETIAENYRSTVAAFDGRI